MSWDAFPLSNQAHNGFQSTIVPSLIRKYTKHYSDVMESHGKPDRFESK